jgi:hypothetical protein
MADRNCSQDRYETLLYGEGRLKTVFKAVKAVAEGRTVLAKFRRCPRRLPRARTIPVARV